MKELEKVEEERRNEKVAKTTIHAVSKGTASNEMCTFLIMNISSLQLIPVNIIAYRSQYHSVFAAAVTVHALCNYGKYSGSGIFLQDHGSFQ